MAIVKRYKRSDNSVEAYHSMHDKLMLMSRILNTDAVPNIGSFLHTKENIKAELVTLMGDKNGQYLRDRQVYTGQIPLLEEKLDALDLKFTKMNLEREQHGLPTFEEYPKHLLTEKLQLEARLDVSLSEKAFLEERLKDFVNKEEQNRKDVILKYGLRQSVQMKDGKIEVIDGQNVTYQNNIPIISEGIYFGLSVQDYRKMADVWLEERRKAEDDAFRKNCEARKRAGLSVPIQKKVSSVKAIDKSSLPKFPEWAKRMLTI